jgi:hypothetical protein
MYVIGVRMTMHACMQGVYLQTHLDAWTKQYMYIYISIYSSILGPACTYVYIYTYIVYP